MTRRLLTTVSAVLLLASGMQAEERTMPFGYCGDPVNSVGIQTKNVYYGAAMQIPAETAARLAGCEVKAVQVGFGTGVNKEVTVFLTHDLGGTPFVTEEGQVRVRQFNDIELTTPYVIDGSEFYVGYIYKSKDSVNFPIGIDNESESVTSYGNWYSQSLSQEGLATSWTHLDEDFGNVCVRILVSGENLPQWSCIPLQIELPGLARPGKPFEVLASVRNQGCEPIRELEISYEVGETSSGISSVTLEEPCDPGKTVIISYEATVDEDGKDLPFTMSVSRINGNPNDDPERCVSGAFTCSDRYYFRNVVAEKYTGLSCGYCPLGIYGFSEMEKNVTDGSFIPIAVHNFPGNDPMVCGDYDGWVKKYNPNGQAPMATVNRVQEYGLIQPDPATLQALYHTLHGACPVNISVGSRILEGGKSAWVSSVSTFAEKTQGSAYGYSVVLTEDNLGPYPQMNYFGDGSLGTMGGYEDEPNPVMTVYNGVARAIYDWSGSREGLPSIIEAGESVNYGREVSLANCTDPANVNVIVMLVNRMNGEIVTAASRRLGTSDSGVSETGADDGRDFPAVIAANGVVKVYGEYEKATVYGADGRVAGEIRPGGEATVGSGIYIVVTETADGRRHADKVIM